MPTDYNKNVSRNWKPVEALEQRKPGMDWTDRLWYWLVTLGGLALIGAGVAIAAYAHLTKIPGAMIGFGIVCLFLGTPSRAARNGYRGI